MKTAKGGFYALTLMAVCSLVGVPSYEAAAQHGIAKMHHPESDSEKWVPIGWVRKPDGLKKALKALQAAGLSGTGQGLQAIQVVVPQSDRERAIRVLMKVKMHRTLSASQEWVTIGWVTLEGMKKAFKALKAAGIPARGQGDRAYDIDVPQHDLERAVKILRKDAVKNKYEFDLLLD